MMGPRRGVRLAFGLRFADAFPAFLRVPGARFFMTGPDSSFGPNGVSP